jgi:hypothetical protein
LAQIRLTTYTSDKGEKMNDGILDQILGAVKKFTEIGIALLALGIVMQVIFGTVVPFVGGDIIGHVINIVAMLGAQGLVGLVAVGVIWAIFTR